MKKSCTLACILHDLGLTERFQSESPFEIQGAETAKRFLREQGYAKEKLGIVWDGIAMHASPIGQFKQPEIALVGEGAGADVIGPDFSQVAKSDVEEIVKAFPRLKFKDAFVKTCADEVRKHPQAASSSFMRDIRERYVPEFHATSVIGSQKRRSRITALAAEIPLDDVRAMSGGSTNDYLTKP